MFTITWINNNTQRRVKKGETYNQAGITIENESNDLIGSVNRLNTVVKTPNLSCTVIFKNGFRI